MPHRLARAARALWLVPILGWAGLAMAQSPPAAPRPIEPGHLEEGWNLPSPPLPPEVLEGTTLQRTVRIRRSDGQPPTEAWLNSQLQGLELDTDGRAAPCEKSGAEFRCAWTAPAAGKVQVNLRARTATGVRDGPVLAVTVYANVRLKVAADKVDFGAVAGGCGLQQHCKPVDFAGSQHLRGGQKLAVSRPTAQPDGSPGWPELLVHVRAGPGTPLIPVAHGGPAVVVDYVADKPVELCYAAPRCGPVPARPAAAVLLQPIGKGLVEADRAARVVLLAAVAPTPLWQCYLPWILAVAAAVVAVFVVVGIIKPDRFPNSAMLFVGAQEAQLARDGGRPLYSAPGGRRGFYRSATCTFDGSGMTVRKGAGGAVVLHADGRDIRIEQRTQVEVKERQRWRVLPPEEKVLQRGVVHRVGKAFHFRVD
ncbi:MAG: hypothetical protein FJ100_23460 [Deltaproteobacteria bacterium]|nr:hypothetical protein [Deltaproteobacteria bacterium]